MNAWRNTRAKTPAATLTRRALLRRGLRLGVGLAALGLLPGCEGGVPQGQASSAAAVSPAPAAPVGRREAGTVFVRTAGGSYEEALRKSTWEPFSAATGIQVVPVAANTAKVLAMVQSGNVEIDLLDINEPAALILQDKGALEKIDRSRFSLTNLVDVEPVTDHYVGYNVFAEVLVYNTDAFPGRRPRGWADLWDVAAFPGPRMLQDAKSIAPNLEFALLADGVPMDRLYPLDVERALSKLRQIRRHVPKWWDTGAVGTQMLVERQAVLGSMWNNRVQGLIDAGMPLAIEWNQGQRILETSAILKGAPNRANAYKLLDFALQPQVQARLQTIALSPANRRAFDYIDPSAAASLPTAPTNLARTFANDAAWWVQNREKIAERWQEFLLEG